MRWVQSDEGRTCRKCGEFKGGDAFEKNGTYADGTVRWRSICKACGSRRVTSLTGPRRCHVCGETKDPTEFPGDGKKYVTRCRVCLREQVYARVKTPEGRRRRNAWMKEYHRLLRVDGKLPPREAAHQAVFRAVRSGKLKRPERCSFCAVKHHRVEAHHHKGYDKANQLNVRWLCPECHARADNRTTFRPRLILKRRMR